MILGYDTETTNLPLWNDPSDDPRQPHLIQLAMILYEMDGTEVDRFSSIVQPGPGAVMGKEAFEAHGISLERAMAEGCCPKMATAKFIEWAGKAKLRVGHNESFDRRIMRIAAARHLGFKWEAEAPAFCTLYKSKFIVNLPATPKMIAAGVPGPKSPKLEECIRHFFDEPLDGAHDALVDVEASMRVFWHLVNEIKVPMFKARRAA
ncbi:MULTISPECIES: 3'-5' exonuclease [unclassified Blastomonas]|uniref:3'-5' exonuclease n=1 Tax=unclassified Blastomonas TaxID=2626550 RepID=UPI00082708CA|nr:MULTISPECIES: 3'-5' exonuclease [unclassified Blastomonas]